MTTLKEEFFYDFYIFSHSWTSIAYLLLFSGAGRRRWRAGNVGAPWINHEPPTLLHHIGGLLWCQEDPRSSLRKTETLPALLSCLHWVWYGFCYCWPWENNSLWQVIITDWSFLNYNELFVYWRIWNKPWSAFFCRFCAGDIDDHMDIFIDIYVTKNAVIQAGTAIFQYIHHRQGTTLGQMRFNIFSRKAAAGLIKPETLPPTKGAAAQHSLRAYLQTRFWILLQSMSPDPSDYGWILGVHGYEPVPTLDPMAQEELLQFISCNCKGNCSNRRCSCKKNGVKCISASGGCKGITCKNIVHDGVEDSDIDFWSIWIGIIELVLLN